MIAKNIRDQATTAKRTATSITKVVDGVRGHREWADAELLGQKDIEQLQRAAAILNQFGSKAAQAAKAAKSREGERERAIANARREAAAIMATWPPAETVLDKVALIIGNHGEHNLRLDLQSEQRNYAWSLNFWFEETMREIPHSAAFNSVRNARPVAEIMAAVPGKIAEIKARPGTLELAGRWEAKIAAEQFNAPKG